MAYATPDGKRSGTTRRHQGRAGDSRSGNGTVTSSGKRKVTARGGSSNQYKSRRNYRTISGNDAGYSLRQHNIRFNGRRGGLVGKMLDDPRLFVLFLLALLLVLAALFGVSSCVRKRAEANKAPTVSESDSRVAAGLTSELTDRITAQLDSNEQFANIAINADKLDDERLVELALDEPTAIAYVAGFLQNDAPKTQKTFNDPVSVGTYPMIYNWDTRWGYAPYGSSYVGLTGSGVTSFAMACIGLTGRTDVTPATLAELSTETNTVSETYGTSAEFFMQQAQSLGMEIEEYTPAPDLLPDLLDQGTVVLLQLREGTITDHAHWALAVGENLDGSIILQDPTNTSVNDHSWNASTLAGASEHFYVLEAAEAEEESTGW